MIILYTTQSNEFIDIKKLSECEKLQIDNIYINITNRCHCSCTFCLRKYEVADEGNSLWLENEPTVEQVIDEFQNINLDNCKEIIFCGFGEPLERADEVIQVSRYLKERNSKIKIRINTNGLANLIQGKDIPPMLEGIVDTISISLNASSKEKYLEITNSKFGIESFDAMIDFTKKCKRYIPNIVLTVVDIIGEEEIDKCKKICEELSVLLRVRHYIPVDIT